jgi:hypothetical protein
LFCKDTQKALRHTELVIVQNGIGFLSTGGSTDLGKPVPRLETNRFIRGADGPFFWDADVPLFLKRRRNMLIAVFYGNRICFASGNSRGIGLEDIGH